MMCFHTYNCEEAIVRTRVLVAFEEQYRFYQAVIARAIQIHRPHVEVAATGLDALEDEVARFDPHLVICSQAKSVDTSDRPAWFKLPPDPSRVAEIWLGGQRSEAVNPPLEELLRIVDETERLIRTEPYPAASLC
jgi:hypothetical protein